ncbi:MAG: PfkB family carbohydrate kinase [Silicimonas sp.]|nr:PfkB family carbohydrate kinase [Silicimonas sp.]
MSAACPLPKVLCVGRLYCDMIFTDLPRLPTAGTEVFAGGLGLHAGGGAAITAGHLAALGHRAALAAYLPGAGFGAAVRAELDPLGIDLSLCAEAPGGLDPQVTVAMVQAGERAFVTRRIGAAFPALSADALQAAGVTHLHLGEATTLIDNPDLIALARGVGATLSLDCSWDDGLDAAALARLLPQVDVFLPNGAEARFLRNAGVGLGGAPLTVIKEGERGARAVTAEREWHAPARIANVVDTTGAGDAFNAGFLGAWLQKAPLPDCLAAGNASGANSITRRGGLGGLRLSESRATSG